MYNYLQYGDKIIANNKLFMIMFAKKRVINEKIKTKIDNVFIKRAGVGFEPTKVRL